MPLGKIRGTLAIAGMALLANPAKAALADLTLAPLSVPVGTATLRLDGDGGGALFGPDQPGWRGAGISGVLRAMPQLRRDYDSGLSLDLTGTFAVEDPLSRGRYDGDVTEKLVGEAHTGLGTLGIGIADGAGYALAVTGPRVDAGVSLDDPRTSFFPRSRQPSRGNGHVRAAYAGWCVEQLCQVHLCQPRTVRGAAGVVLRPQRGQAVALLECGAACRRATGRFLGGGATLFGRSGPGDAVGLRRRWRRAAPSTSCRDRKASAIWARAQPSIIR